MINTDHWPDMTAEQSVAVMFAIAAEMKVAANWCRLEEARALPLADAIRIVTRGYLAHFYNAYGIVFESNYIHEFMGAARGWLTEPRAGKMEAA